MSEESDKPEAASRSGGCLCGAVRYQVAWPPLGIAVCHCRDCQKQGGSALSVVGISSLDAIAVSGELATFSHAGSSGKTVDRQFCSNCGSPVLSVTQDARDQGLIFFKAGTLDDVSDLMPTEHYWTRSAQPWFAFSDAMTCHTSQ